MIGGGKDVNTKNPFEGESVRKALLLYDASFILNFKRKALKITLKMEVFGLRVKGKMPVMWMGLVSLPYPFTIDVFHYSGMANLPWKIMKKGRD